MLSDKSLSSNINIEDLLEQFSSSSNRKRRGLINSLEERSQDIACLGVSPLIPYDPEGDDWAAGFILQLLKRQDSEILLQIVPSDSGGWFNSPSSSGIDYAPLQNALISEDFEQADRLTSSYLRKLAGQQAEARGYVYFSEVADISNIDLVTMDRLWKAYSQGRFGFSVQARLLKTLGGRYDRLWPRIGWKVDGVWTRYPKSFTWSINAPEGHMPLVNQLRGVRLMDALLTHPGLSSRLRDERP